MSGRLRYLAAGVVLSSGMLASSMAGTALGANTDWPTYHHDNLRTADAVLPGTFTSLTPSWTWHVPSGAGSSSIYASPVIAGGLVIVTSEDNWVYALHAANGSLAWKRDLGDPEIQGNGVCGDIGPTIGITSTPVVDEARGEVFVVAARGTGANEASPVRHLYGLGLTTGSVELNRVVEPGGVSDTYELQRTALGEDNGRILIGYGGNDGDCGTYHGWLESVSGSNPTAPINSFEVDPAPGENQGAIWMGGAAPSIDAKGNVWVATGNGNSCAPGSPYDFGDSLLKLNASMKLLDFFAPTYFRSDNCHDLDLGSGAPQLLRSGIVVQIGKTHRAYLLHQSSLGHINAHPTTFSVCPNGQDNGGAAIISQSATVATMAIPCEGGLQKVTVRGGTTPSGSVDWTASVGTAPPIFAAGSLVAISPDPNNSTLYVIDPTTGAVTLQADIGPEMNHFATPAAGDGILVAAGSGTVYAYRP